MFIIFAFRHLKLSGTVRRDVVCERCRHEYNYSLTRTAALDTVPLPSLIRREDNRERRYDADKGTRRCVTGHDRALGWRNG